MIGEYIHKQQSDLISIAMARARYGVGFLDLADENRGAGSPILSGSKIRLVCDHMTASLMGVCVSNGLPSSLQLPIRNGLADSWGLLIV
jgi:hypothetical protein